MMVVQIKFKKIVTSILLVTIISTFYSQTNNFFSNYAKFSLGVSGNYYLRGKSYYSFSDTPVTYTYDKFLSASFYAEYNIFNKNKHKIFIGAKISLYYEVNTLIIEPGQYENTPVGTIFREETSSDDTIKSLIIKYSYNFKINRLNSYIFCSVLPGFEIPGKSGYTEIGMRTINFESSEYYKDGIFRFNIEVGFGINLKTKYIIIQPHLFFNKSFTDIWYADFIIEGIRNRSYTKVNGYLKQSGDYFALGINFIPKKLWNKKRKY